MTTPNMADIVPRVAYIRTDTRNMVAEVGEAMKRCGVGPDGSAMEVGVGEFK